MPTFAKKKWWKRSRASDRTAAAHVCRRCTEVDPISLEPLAELDYPPFELRAADSAVVHYFDGEVQRAAVQQQLKCVAQVLAYYMISQGIFNNPITRQVGASC